MGRHSRQGTNALVLVLSAVLGLAATASAQDVRPFTEIEATPLTITPDPSGRSAVLTVDTSVDVACSVVYGVDETFGSLSTDTDMAGGAHSHHHPVLGGLEPDTEYVSRIQGTAPDGTIYVSDVMRFRTAPAPAGGPVDLAIGATIVGVSSEFSAAFAAANAFDGDGTTEWSSAGDGDDAWVEIDLGSEQAIGEIVFRTRSMSDGTAVARTFTITADGAELGTYPTDEPVALDLTARSLRFDVASSTGGNTGAVEILVLAPEDQAT